MDDPQKERRPQTLSDDDKELTEKISWLLLLRVVILSFFLGATALFHFFRTEGDLSYLTESLSPANLCLCDFHWFRRHLAANTKPPAVCSCPGCFDVVLITGIIWITGDIASPFSFLYNLAVMNGAILLFYRGAFFTAGCSSLSYVGLLLWSNITVPPPESRFPGRCSFRFS